MTHNDTQDALIIVNQGNFISDKFRVITSPQIALLYGLCHECSFSITPSPARPRWARTTRSPSAKIFVHDERMKGRGSNGKHMVHLFMASLDCYHEFCSSHDPERSTHHKFCNDPPATYSMNTSMTLSVRLYEDP